MALEYIFDSCDTFRCWDMLKRGDLMTVGAEYVVFAAAEVRVYLTREEGIFGDVCLAAVFIEGEE
jgi:hypothetical protein